jgi:hypothetical protein
MTEQEWLDASDPRRMLEILRKIRKVSNRKLRLFAVACCRHIWPLLCDDASRRAVQVAERFADGLANSEHLSAALEALLKTLRVRGAQNSALVASVYAAVDEGVVPGRPSGHVQNESMFDEGANFHAAADLAAWHAARSAQGKAFKRQQKLQSSSLRDIAGNPFRPKPVFEPAWRAPGVLALAREMYNSGTFNRMPALADALQAAGCTDDDILRHCRVPTAHARGCWVVDLILNRE